jgi:hypothetical protein
MARSTKSAGISPWEIHGEIRRKVQTLLNTQHLIPEKLYIQSDGWTEAYFLSGPDHTEVAAIWGRLRDENRVELESATLLAETADTLYVVVHFRIIEQPTQWQRIRSRLTSIAATAATG